MIEIAEDGKIILRDLILSESIEVFHNCKSIYTGLASDSNTSLNIGIQVDNGVYQVVQPSQTYNYFYYDNTCLVVEKFSKELFYYWTALNLASSCSEQYPKLCTIYTEFENQLKEECYDCL